MYYLYNLYTNFICAKGTYEELKPYVGDGYVLVEAE